MKVFDEVSVGMEWIDGIQEQMAIGRLFYLLFLLSIFLGSNTWQPTRLVSLAEFGRICGKEKLDLDLTKLSIPLGKPEAK